MVVAVIINALAFGLLVLSVVKSREKTVQSVKLALMKLISLLPWMLGILLIIGIVLGFVPPETIEAQLGGDPSALQVVIAAVAGTIAMIPNIIGVPLIASLVDSGASYTTAAAFLTTLLMVGFITMPMEIRELGVRITLWRNLLAFLAAVVIALVIGQLMHLGAAI